MEPLSVDHRIDNEPEFSLPSSVRPVMRHLWRDLLFLHWVVPAVDLQRLLPPELVVDTYEGQAYIALVPFQLRTITLASVPPLLVWSAFGEINVRTYVRGPSGEPGVWFFSLDATALGAVLGARSLYKLPYFPSVITQAPQPEAHIGDATPRIYYTARRRGFGARPATCDVAYIPDGNPVSSQPGTLEHFLVERYSLYSAHHGRLYIGRIAHDPYPLEVARIEHLTESLIAAAGIARPECEPIAHYSRGVDVDVGAIRTAGDNVQRYIRQR